MASIDKIQVQGSAYDIIAASAKDYTSNGSIKTALDGKVPTGRKVNGKALSADITLNAANVSAISTTARGIANGVASLDANGKVPTGQLPANVSVSGENGISASAAGNTYYLGMTDEYKNYYSPYGQPPTIGKLYVVQPRYPNQIEVDISGQREGVDTAYNLGLLVPTPTSHSAKRVLIAQSGQIADVLWQELDTLYNVGTDLKLENGIISVNTDGTVSNSAEMSFVAGSGTYASGVGAAAFGISASAIGQGSFADGASTSAVGLNAHAEGGNTSAVGANSHAEGGGTLASGGNSHAEGGGTYAVGEQAHAEGGGASAIAANSHAEGGGTLASSIYSHSEGIATSASNIASHAEGADTYAAGSASHAEGSATNAVGAYSHSEGRNTSAVGNQSHAEGYNTSAIGNNSHTEGGNTRAIGGASHAEGGSTWAVGDGSHAEGGGTYASGNFSHTEGDHTSAFGTYTHVGGAGSRLYGNRGFVHGNSVDASGDDLFVIGLGNKISANNSVVAGERNQFSAYNVGNLDRNYIFGARNSANNLMSYNAFIYDNFIVGESNEIYSNTANYNFVFGGGNKLINDSTEAIKGGYILGHGNIIRGGGYSFDYTLDAKDNVLFGIVNSAVGISNSFVGGSGCLAVATKVADAYAPGWYMGPKYHIYSAWAHTMPSFAFGVNTSAKGGIAMGIGSVATLEQNVYTDTYKVGYITSYAEDWYGGTGETYQPDGENGGGVALGSFVSAYNAGSFACGLSGLALAPASFVAGKGNTAVHYGQAVIGKYADANTAYSNRKAIFVVGDGTSNTNLSNAFVVYEGGYIGNSTNNGVMTLVGSLSAAGAVSAAHLDSLYGFNTSGYVTFAYGSNAIFYSNDNAHSVPIYCDNDAETLNVMGNLYVNGNATFNSPIYGGYQEHNANNTLYNLVWTNTANKQYFYSSALQVVPKYQRLQVNCINVTSTANIASLDVQTASIPIVIGSTANSAQNMLIDSNEILARIGTGSGTLWLQDDGGIVVAPTITGTSAKYTNISGTNINGVNIGNFYNSARSGYAASARLTAISCGNSGPGTGTSNEYGPNITAYWVKQYSVTAVPAGKTIAVSPTFSFKRYGSVNATYCTFELGLGTKSITNGSASAASLTGVESPASNVRNQAAAVYFGPTGNEQRELLSPTYYWTNTGTSQVTAYINIIKAQNKSGMTVETRAINFMVI